MDICSYHSDKVQNYCSLSNQESCHSFIVFFKISVENGIAFHRFFFTECNHIWPFDFFSDGVNGLQWFIFNYLNRIAYFTWNKFHFTLHHLAIPVKKYLRWKKLQWEKVYLSLWILGFLSLVSLRTCGELRWDFPAGAYTWRWHSCRHQNGHEMLRGILCYGWSWDVLPKPHTLVGEVW